MSSLSIGGVLIAGLAFMSVGLTVVEGQEDAQRGFPSGIYWLGPRGKAVPETILGNKSVRGVVLRMRWQEVEPQEGHYDWGYFEQAINQAAQAGKAVSLRVNSGGRNTPQWVMNLPGIEKLSFTDRNPYHRENFGNTVTIPVFWDPLFLTKKKQLIKAWGARFGSTPHVATVGMSCANALTGDWNVPDDTPEDLQQWRKLGYSPERLVNACKEILDATTAAFPGKVVTLGVGGSKLDRPPSRVAQAVMDYAYAQYPGRFMAMWGSLSARTPDPTKGRLPKLWQIVFNHRPHIGAQMLWGVTEDDTFRMNAKAAGDRKEIFQRAMQIGINYGLSFIEVYHGDLVNPQFVDILERAAAELGKERN